MHQLFSSFILKITQIIVFNLLIKVLNLHLIFLFTVKLFFSRENMNVVEMKTSSLILCSVIWFPDCPDDGDAITDYPRTENTQPASTCTNLSEPRVHCSVMVSARLPGKVWETSNAELRKELLILKFDIRDRGLNV